jgi:hypothetical protein
MRSLDPEIALCKMEKGRIDNLCWVEVWCTYGHVNTRDQYLASVLKLLKYMYFPVACFNGFRFYPQNPTSIFPW